MVDHFANNKEFAALQEDIDGLHQELIDTFHEAQVSPGWRQRQARAEQFLRNFIGQIYLDKLYRHDTTFSFSVDDFLATRPPRRDLAQNRGFWKLLTRFLMVRLKPDYVGGETKRSIKTVLSELDMLSACYKRLTGNQVDYDLLMECKGFIESNALDKVRPKPIATFENVVSFIKDGIFGDHFLFRCPREQAHISKVRGPLCQLRSQDLWVVCALADPRDDLCRARELRRAGSQASGQSQGSARA